MRKYIWLIPLVLLLITNCLASYPKDVEFRITGTQGLTFSGSYGNISSSLSIDGTIPASYTTELEDEYDVVSGVFQKDEEIGTLTVGLYVDGDLKETNTTTAAYGIVSVSYSD